VDDIGLMRRQNDTLRKYARGKFATLLNAAVREPALLLYLDAPTNRKGHANENLGRELMELFHPRRRQLHRGRREGSRPRLTGWSVDDGNFVEQAERHDDGRRPSWGRRARSTARGCRSARQATPAADRIALKLVRQFFGDAGVSADATNRSPPASASMSWTSAGRSKRC